MICDYFVLDNVSGVLGRSGHKYTAFAKLIRNSGFKIVDEKNITHQVTKTLDLARDIVDRIMAAMDIATRKIRTRHPYACRLFTRFITQVFSSKMDQVSLIDSRAFVRSKTYRYFLLQRPCFSLTLLIAASSLSRLGDGVPQAFKT